MLEGKLPSNKDENHSILLNQALHTVISRDKLCCDFAMDFIKDSTFLTVPVQSICRPINFEGYYIYDWSTAYRQL